jgi:hypothetical protein
MVDHADAEPAAGPGARPPHRVIVRAVLRAVGSTAALVALVALVVFQVRWIIRSRFPGLWGVEALATSIPLFLLLFASTYVVLATISAGNFSEPLTRCTSPSPCSRRSGSAISRPRRRRRGWWLPGR